MACEGNTFESGGGEPLSPVEQGVVAWSEDVAQSVPAPAVSADSTILVSIEGATYTTMKWIREAGSGFTVQLTGLEGQEYRIDWAVFA
jgi:hypothetical protein